MLAKKSDLLIGAHTSAAGGVQNALYEGQRIGATTVQLFTSNQKRWVGKKFTPADVGLWEKALHETGLRQIMSHDSYLINLGSPAEEMRQKSVAAFQEEVERCHALKIAFLNFHPGAALHEDPQVCLDRISESLLSMKALIHKGDTRLLLEATAGQGSSVGYRFEQLSYIVEKVKHAIPIGVCIDTCHIFAAGYDIRTKEGWEKVLKEFDDAVGLNHLYAFHLNDSAKGLGTRVDRHKSLGEGLIGMECFRYLVTDSRTKHLPMYLETPEGPEVWKKEIAMLKEMR